jgi:hypothetical protein
LVFEDSAKSCGCKRYSCLTSNGPNWNRSFNDDDNAGKLLRDDDVGLARDYDVLIRLYSEALGVGSEMFPARKEGGKWIA